MRQAFAAVCNLKGTAILYALSLQGRQAQASCKRALRRHAIDDYSKQKQIRFAMVYARRWLGYEMSGQ